MTTPYRAYLRSIEHYYLAHEVANIAPRMPIIEAPFVNPCAKGHQLTTRGGMLVCARCGTVIGAAPKPKPPKRGGGLW